MFFFSQNKQSSFSFSYTFLREINNLARDGGLPSMGVGVVSWGVSRSPVCACAAGECG